jgi:hypothetical protein
MPGVILRNFQIWKNKSQARRIETPPLVNAVKHSCRRMKKSSSYSMLWEAGSGPGCDKGDRLGSRFKEASPCYHTCKHRISQGQVMLASQVLPWEPRSFLIALNTGFTMAFSYTYMTCFYHIHRNHHLFSPPTTTAPLSQVVSLVFSCLCFILVFP